MEQLKKAVDFLKSIKELALVLMGIGLLIVAGINYFVTRSEMKQLQCQIMYMMEVANDQIIILNGRRDEDAQIQDIAMYNALTAPTDAQKYARDQKKLGVENIEKVIGGLADKVNATRERLEKGECYTGESDEKKKIKKMVE